LSNLLDLSSTYLQGDGWQRGILWHTDKEAPALALQYFLASLRAKEHVIVTISLCVAETLIR